MQTAHAKAEERYVFADEPAQAAAAGEPWKVLVADDEDAVHQVTRLALADFTYQQRPLRLLEARSAAEAVSLVAEHPDIALVLMDVVMESEHAGLDAVLAIRQELRNRLTRIVIRTGQPGRAPESEVVRRYDINDYREKTEITARKLQTLVHNGLRLYSEVRSLSSHKDSLEQVIGAAATLQAQRSEEAFARSALQQLAVLLYADAPRMPSDMLLALRGADGASRVLAGTGYYRECAGRRLEEALSPEALMQVQSALDQRPVVLGRPFLARAAVAGGGDLLAYIGGDEAPRPVDPAHVALFCRNIAGGFDTLRLHRELAHSQRRLVLLLATAVEQRVGARAGHGERVAHTVRVLGGQLGLEDEALERLTLAVTLHDTGEIAIPEDILGKAGPLTAPEQALFETHTRWGHDLLAQQDTEVLRVAAQVADQHHERWDGQGYPAGLAGTAIHLYARLTAVADALDDLTHGPDALTFDQAVARIEADRGSRFDPQVVDLLLQNRQRLRPN